MEDSSNIINIPDDILYTDKEIKEIKRIRAKLEKSRYRTNDEIIAYALKEMDEFILGIDKKQNICICYALTHNLKDITSKTYQEMCRYIYQTCVRSKLFRREIIANKRNKKEKVLFILKTLKKGKTA